MDGEPSGRPTAAMRCPAVAIQIPLAWEGAGFIVRQAKSEMFGGEPSRDVKSVTGERTLNPAKKAGPGVILSLWES